MKQFPGETPTGISGRANEGNPGEVSYRFPGRIRVAVLDGIYGENPGRIN